MQKGGDNHCTFRREACTLIACSAYKFISLALVTLVMSIFLKMISFRKKTHLFQKIVWKLILTGLWHATITNCTADNLVSPPIIQSVNV